jgi:hypothetical protein
MMIVDAVGSAPSEHAVYFLVTAYMESLRNFERTCGVPPRVLDLPVAGAADLSERLGMLRGESGAPPGSAVVVSEIDAVLTSALGRLSALGDPVETAPPIPASAAIHSSRSDSQHSALSV